MSEEVEKPGRDAAVSLREIKRETLRPFLRMKVAESQERMVANNAVSIAQAHFEPKAWFRGIYADETPVGFIMLYDDPEEPVYFLWRLMVADEFQGMGYGRKAIAQLVEYVKTRPNATELKVSHVPELPGNPGPFYQKLGFEYTGEEDDGELVMRLKL
ncbi:MAG: GNAT family N-acetyltransferase [Ardenticatenaceae bacterium]|nr:GNAT family N-acetyltransferase [Ardenticatenaceae bacterium]MCB8949450.1 GNAT family N-acetyltransferase [Ardenticatenaceae bacterium]